MTRHLVDPELLPTLDAFPAFDLSDGTLPTFRAGQAGMIPPPEAYARPDVTIETAVLPGTNGLRVILYRPATAAPCPALLSIHGGGYVLGGAADTGAASVRTASEVGCLVVSVEYRLAPETTAPGSVEDCYAALLWMYREAPSLGIDPERIAIGGESAGGGLAAALALLARDRGEVPVLFQMLIYPMLDDRTVVEDTPNPVTGSFIWTRTNNAYGWRSLLGQAPGGSGISAYQAAGRAEDVSNLPPAYISVGALDLFLDENLAYAARLLRAGVPTELHVWPGAYHGFEMAVDAGVARAAEQERRQALHKAFTGRTRG